MPNLKSLILSISQNQSIIDAYQSEHLIKSTLPYLDIFSIYSYDGIENSSVLLELLKETPQLSSLFIQLSELISFLNDNELCKYLNKMIKRLDLYGDSNKIFYDPSKNLPNLSTVEVKRPDYSLDRTKEDYSEFKNELQQLNSSVQARVGQSGGAGISNTKKSPQCVVRIGLDVEHGYPISST
ncbi:unnamed protein product [Rotaria sordida]|uniref:Uncharacterized protein n=1 Tax=Rotaria sordida TaxID=392033 RepID=A0A819AYJ8_9BILA|nr:unnamed protein product [Rotaria sordida]CAF3851548.1 unnamed protein product [Rotaria sordida]